MHPELSKLAHLQELEEQRTALAAEIAGVGRSVAQRQAALHQAGSALEENKKSLSKESIARRRMESDTDDLRQKSARYRAQLENVQSEDQAKALQHQIVFCRQEIDRIEELEFASLIQTESLENRQRTLHETIANLTAALHQEKADAQLAESRAKARRQELDQESATLRKSIEAHLLAEYDRISSAHKSAVALVEAQRCGVCRMMVRPQRWNEIRAGEVHFCESCGRFLFYNPPVDLSDAVRLPPVAKKPAGPLQGFSDDSGKSSPPRAAAAGDGQFPRED